MHVAPRIPAIIVAAILSSSAGSAAAQQGAYAYPNAGQDEAQQSKDRYECHQWAVTQSGFDPTTASPLPAQPVPPPSQGYSDQPPPQQGGSGILGIGNGGMFQGGGMLGDAATGAALGAAGGAIAGDAGQGAAIGAVASTLFGALNRANSQPAPQPRQADNDYYYRQQQAQAAQAYNQRMQLSGEYNRAFGACMSARNYTVQ